MKTTSLPSVEERKEELRTYFDKLLKPKKPTMKNLDREILADWLDNVLTQDRNQAYTRLVEGIEGMRRDQEAKKENDPHFTGCGGCGEQYPAICGCRYYNQCLIDILEKVVKPLYNKTGDN